MKPKSATKSDSYHIIFCVFSVCTCSFDVWPSFQVTTCIFPLCQCWQNNWLCMERHKYDQTNFYCKFWLHSLDVNLFESFWWYLWLKMVFKMSQDIPTTSLAITYNFFHSFFSVVMTQNVWCCEYFLLVCTLVFEFSWNVDTLRVYCFGSPCGVVCKKTPAIQFVWF